jgi:hypothetical protein
MTLDPSRLADTKKIIRDGSDVASPPDVATAPTDEKGSEQCICAAIRLRNGEVWRGHRHDSAIHTAMAAPDIKSQDIANAEQGFITSRNRFVGREEGAQIQRAAGIVSAQTMQPVSDMLFSEDLYLRDWRESATSVPAVATSVDEHQAVPSRILFLEQELVRLQAERDEALQQRDVERSRYAHYAAKFIDLASALERRGASAWGHLRYEVLATLQGAAKEFVKYADGQPSPSNWRVRAEAAEAARDEAQREVERLLNLSALARLKGER